MFNNKNENTGMEKYTNQLKIDIERDEDGKAPSEGEATGVESNDAPKSPPYTLGRFFKLFGSQVDTPYVFIIEKIHSLLGQYGKSGLDAQGKADIETLVSELNKTAPEVGQVLSEIFNDYGYDIDMEIPREFAIIGHTAIAAWRIHQIKQINLKRMNGDRSVDDLEERMPKSPNWVKPSPIQNVSTIQVVE